MSARVYGVAKGVGDGVVVGHNRLEPWTGREDGRALLFAAKRPGSSIYIRRRDENNVPDHEQRKDYTDQRRPYTKTDNVVGNRIVDIEDLVICTTPDTKNTTAEKCATGLALYSNKRLSFTQACMGVQLWRQGCPLKVFTTLDSLGVSHSVFSARGHVNWLRLGHDSQVNVWKQEVENIAASARRQLLFHQDAPSTGYSLTWDNVQRPIAPHSN
ncbi:hypothetical protein Bbelb_317940 [Branchiostoma belcheri]|nr:hypothetical protein Bbelb_317940 [Branchiostoma belcheri]